MATRLPVHQICPRWQERGVKFDVERKDPDGRLLAYLYPMGEGMFNEVLLRKGYAQVYAVKPNDEHRDDCEAAQNKAKEGDLGIWGLPEDRRCELANHGNGIGKGSPACKTRLNPAPKHKHPPATPSGTSVGPDLDCSDLTYKKAQAEMSADPSDPFDLDADGNGVACNTWCFVGQLDVDVSSDRIGRLSTGFEDDHRNLPLGPLLVAGVALESSRDLWPELLPLLFGGDAGVHGASSARHRDPYLWVGLEVEVPCRVPVIASEGSDEHQSLALDDRDREHRWAFLTRSATGTDEFDEGHPEGSGEDSSLREVEDLPMDTGAHLVEGVLGFHATISISLRVSYLGSQ